MKLLASFIAAIALAGCGGKTKAPDTTTTTTEVKAEIVLELGSELSLFEGEQQIAKIHADGKTEIDEGGGKWGPGPTLKADGTVEHEGKVVVKVGADGSITDVGSGQKLPFTVDGEKITLVDGDKQMTIELGANGLMTVVGEEQPKKPLRVDGASTPGQRKTALVFLTIMVAGRGEPPPPPNGAGGEKPPEATPPVTP